MWLNLRQNVDGERGHTVPFHVQKVLESAKLIYSDRSHFGGCLGLKGERYLQRGLRIFLR